MYYLIKEENNLVEIMEVNTMKTWDEMYMIRTWEEFREMCAADAYNWYDAGYKASELSADDILDEYPVDAFTASPEDARDGEKSFQCC